MTARPDDLPLDRIRAIQSAIRSLAQANLAALLAGKPPVAPDRGCYDGLIPGPKDDDPLQGYTLAAWQRGDRPEAGLAARLMAQPGIALALASPRSQIGGAVLLPLLLRDALAEGAFRHALADLCRRYLGTQVLFHPGPPPAPLFSTGGLALLVASQEAHGQGLGAGFARLRDAAENLRDPRALDGLVPWDQWLLRRMADTPGWTVPAGLETLPYVAWRAADGPPPDPPQAQGPLPAYWACVLDLAL